MGDEKTMLKTSKLREYHSFITLLVSDMNEIEKTLNFNHSDNLVLSEDFYYSVIDVLVNLNDMIYKKIIDRVYNNSSFKDDEDTENIDSFLRMLRNDDIFSAEFDVSSQITEI